MRILSKIFISAVTGAGLLAATAVTASAAGSPVLALFAGTPMKLLSIPRTPGWSCIQTTGAGDKTKNTHGANTRGAAIGAVINGWNGSDYDDQRRATIFSRVVDRT